MSIKSLVSTFDTNIGCKSMSSETAMMADQCRLREWAEQIKECQSRPDGMSIVSWCACHGITKANYYYRLRRVRKAYLENISEEMVPQPIFPVEPGLLRKKGNDNSSPQPFHKGSFHSCDGIHVHALSGRSAQGSAACSMTPSVLKPCILSAGYSHDIFILIISIFWDFFLFISINLWEHMSSSFIFNDCYQKR